MFALPSPCPSRSPRRGLAGAAAPPPRRAAGSPALPSPPPTTAASPAGRAAPPRRRPRAAAGAASGLGVAEAAAYDKFEDTNLWTTVTVDPRGGEQVLVPRLSEPDGYESPFCTYGQTGQGCRVGPRAGAPRPEFRAFVGDEDRVLLKSISFGTPASAGAEDCDSECRFTPRWCIRAGPRARLALDPATVRAALVTCGGLCPGLNDVIRQVVTTLESGYGVTNIVGVPYGYRGFFEPGLTMTPLTRAVVQDIHLEGGSILGTSRGGGDVPRICDAIVARGINALFLLGGNGTHAGAQCIAEELERRKYRCAVVGVPKTIDNDILYLDKTFGFDTAVEEAQRALRAAAIEAKSAYRGVGVVKLMGRQSGFIAMYASIASGEVDVCLIPEVKFAMDGENGVIAHVEHLIRTQGHAIICLAEGAGQEYVQQDGVDASGNPILGDIGPWVVKRIKKASEGRPSHRAHAAPPRPRSLSHARAPPPPLPPPPASPPPRLWALT